jgi:uncharacterized protein (DUF2267 family)
MDLGRYCFFERAEETAIIVFSCLKKVIPEKNIKHIFALLPEPVKSIWESAIFKGTVEKDMSDCITLAKEKGNYPYRAAAERAFEFIFASIREIVDDDKKRKIKELLPSSVQDIFERSRSCTFDSSAEEFL